MPASSEDEKEASVFKTATLPTPGIDYDCDVPPSPPTLCEWTNSVDAIVIGRVRGIGPVGDAYWVFDGTEDPYLSGTPCAGWVKTGIVLRVEVDQTLRDVSGCIREDASVDVVVGAGQTETWANLPLADENDVVWSDPARAPFEIGTTVGLAITQVPDEGVWSLMGEPAFTLEPSGDVVFSSRNDCGWSSPVPAPKKLADLRATVEACSVIDDTEERRKRYMTWNQAPNFAYASECHVPQTPVDERPDAG